MKNIDFAIRMLLACLFILYGASKFYAFMPTPAIAPKAASFMGALISSGYMWPLVGALEIIGGCALLFEKTSNIALLLLGPIVVNIVAYLLILQSAIGLPPIAMACFLSLSFGFLAYRRRRVWSALLRDKLP